MVPVIRTYWKCQSHNSLCYEKNYGKNSLSLPFSLYADLMSGKSHMYPCYVSPGQSYIIVFP